MSNFLTVAENRKRIKDKINFVIRTRLQSEIDAYNAYTGFSTDLELKYPPTINIGTPVLSLDTGAIDQYPCLSIYSESSENRHDDLMSAQTQILDWTIAVVYLCDMADIDYSTEQAQSLCGIVQDTLERFLPDPPGIVGETIYRVDIQNTTDRTPGKIGDGLWMISTSCRMKVYVRSQMNYEPQILSASINFEPFVESAYYPSGSALFGYVGSSPVFNPVATGTLNSMVVGSIPSSVTGSSSVMYLDCRATDIPQTELVDSSYSVIYQRANQYAFGDLSDFSGFVWLNPHPAIQDGDVWNFLITHPTKNTLLAYSVQWSVT